MHTPQIYDVIVIGGSYAGLSAAMALGRSLRTTLVIDAGMPCNRFSPASHNFLTQDGNAPQAISEIARTQVKVYKTVKLLSGFAIQGQQTDQGFRITLDNQQAFMGKKLILATGVKDLLPEIKGFKACWGISVVHCPYCHGYEFKGVPTGILADSEKATHLTGLIRNLTDDLILFEPEVEKFTDRQQQRVEQEEVGLEENRLDEILHTAGHMHAVRLKNGREVPLQALYAAVPFRQHSSIPEALGCVLTENGLLEVDAHQKTSVPGVYACGDNSGGMRSVAAAVYTGNLAGAMVNLELTVQSQA